MDKLVVLTMVLTLGLTAVGFGVVRIAIYLEDKERTYRSRELRVQRLIAAALNNSANSLERMETFLESLCDPEKIKKVTEEDLRARVWLERHQADPEIDPEFAYYRARKKREDASLDNEWDWLLGDDVFEG